MKKILLILALALPACAPQGTDLTCANLAPDGTTSSCMDFVVGYTDDDVYAICSDPHGGAGRISRDPCPREGLIGICTIPSDDGGTFRQHYYPPFTLSQAVELCGFNGTSFEIAR